MSLQYPPSAEQACAEAEDLAMVCRARELSTAEIFEPNAFYANDLILKRYAGLPAQYPLKLVLPHGVNLSDDFLWDVEREALLPAVLCYNDWRCNVYRRKTQKVIFRSAVPFAYLATMLQPPSPVLRSGTLFFPAHSTHRVTALADFDGLADELGRLESKFLPVTVCVYWRDYELGHHLPFLKRGLQVVSAGHIFDPDFLYRFYYLCQRYRYAASNSIGSHLFYSFLSGCSFFLLSGYEVSRSGSAEALRTDVSMPSGHSAEVKRIFATPTDVQSAAQTEFVSRCAGLEQRLEPDELRHTLLMAERLDRYGFAFSPASRQLVTGRPTSIVRALRLGYSWLRRKLISLVSSR